MEEPAKRVDGWRRKWCIGLDSKIGKNREVIRWRVWVHGRE